MKNEFPGQMFEKYQNIKFYDNPSSANRVVTCGQTDVRTCDRQTHDEANSRSSQFCERAQKWKRQDSGPNYSRVQTALIFYIHQLRFERCSELSEICLACVLYLIKTTDSRL